MTNEAEEPQEPSGSASSFDMEMVDSLPGGRSVYPAEKQGRFIWLVAKGAMTEQCFNEMRGYLNYIVDNGLWSQNWDGNPPAQPAVGSDA